MTSPTKRQALSSEFIDRAEKKLRQAEFFLGHLRGFAIPGRSDESMEFHLSASLTAVQSAFYILRDYNRSTFQRELHFWRQTRSDEERAFLNRMMSVRDTDVHFGTLDATSLHTYIDARRAPGVMVWAPPDAFVEMQNPDGTMVRGPSLMDVRAPYIEHAGKRIEATTASGQFVALLRDLVERFKQKAVTSKAGPQGAST